MTGLALGRRFIVPLLPPRLGGNHTECLVLVNLSEYSRTGHRRPICRSLSPHEIYWIHDAHNFPAQAQQNPITDAAAQGSAPQKHDAKHHHYQLVQIPTLGGPGTNFFDNTNNIAVLNARGVVSGDADIAERVRDLLFKI